MTKEKASITVLIPLHNGAQFKSVIRRNLEKLHNHCSFIVSDATEIDGLLAELMLEFPDRSDIEFIGRRELASGWLPHYNYLLGLVHTDFFMWLPQDDEIDPSYLSLNVGKLKQQLNLVGSVGRIISLRNNMEARFDFPPMPKLPKAHLNRRANYFLEHWNHLGVPFRAVFRTVLVRPLLPTNLPNHEWADIVWVYGALLDGEIAQVQDALYYKRFYPGSTHDKWRPLDMQEAESLFRTEIERRSGDINLIEDLIKVCNPNWLRTKLSHIISMVSAQRLSRRRRRYLLKGRQSKIDT
jgi:hypothetical protein